MSVVNHLQVAKLNVWPINGPKLFEPFFPFHSLTFMQVPYFCQLCSPSTLASRQWNSMRKHLLEQFWHFKRTALIIHVNKLLSISAVLAVWGRERETFGAINWIFVFASVKDRNSRRRQAMLWVVLNANDMRIMCQTFVCLRAEACMMPERGTFNQARNRVEIYYTLLSWTRRKKHSIIQQ